MLRQNGGKQARDFVKRHPVVALLAGIVGVCSLPALACMAFLAAISVMVFFSVQGLTCIALATVVGPVFMTGLSVVIFCYAVFKIAQGVCRLTKYVASIPFQMWTKAITVIENMTYPGNLSLIFCICISALLISILDQLYGRCILGVVTYLECYKQHLDPASTPSWVISKTEMFFSKDGYRPRVAENGGFQTRSSG